MNGVDFSYRKVFYCKKVDKKFKPGSPDFLNPKLENMVDFYEDNGLEYLKPIQSQKILDRISIPRT